jgi:tetratricopeptide (TPR) repeat protein
MSDTTSSHNRIGIDGDNNIIYIGNSNKKALTKEEIEAQREKEEGFIFSTTPKKSKEPYINRDIDAFLSNRIAQKNGCVLFLHGQGGIGKSTLLEKFSQTKRPTIFIHLKDSVDMSMVDILMDENKTTVHNCPLFEERLDEIFIKQEERGKIHFNAETELLMALREDFGEHGVFIVDTFEKNKNSHITSRVKFENDTIKFTRVETHLRFRDYLEKLVSILLSCTTFIIAGRNRIGDVNEDRSKLYLDFKEVEEVALKSFSLDEIEKYIQEYGLDNPTQKQLEDITDLTRGNPLPLSLFVKVAQDYSGWDELDYAEMQKIVLEDENYGLIYYFTKRILSHIEIDDIWKLVVPRVLSLEIEKIVFGRGDVFESLVGVGLLHRGKGKERNIYTLHDDVSVAIKSYAKKEFASTNSKNMALVSWHDQKEVREVHQGLMEFYTHKQIRGVNGSFESCYHKIMLREGFEREFEVSRGEFINSFLGLISLDYNSKLIICNNTLTKFIIHQFIKMVLREKEVPSYLISKELYNKITQDLRRGENTSLQDINYLKSLEKYNVLKYDWSLYHFMGHAYDKNEEYEKSIKAYTKAIQINPNKDEAYYNMGLIYVKRREYNKAIELFQKTVKINPKYEDAYFNMGVIYEERKKYDKAIELYQKTVELNPRNINMYNIIGDLYYDKKEYKKAINAYRKIIQINPKKDDAYYYMACSYYANKEYEEAIKIYKKSIKINPKKNNAYSYMSISYIILLKLQLTQNQPFNQELEKEYIKRFQEKKETFIQYEILKIFQAIVQGNEVDLEGWKQKYSGVGLGGWGFDELREWIGGVEDREVRVGLEEALGVFEGW